MNALPWRIRVRAPATTANLGPGFDALGLALQLHNQVEATLSDRLEVFVRGEGEGTLAEGAQNLVYQGVAHAFASRSQAPPPLRVMCDNRIPLARGLGSSAAAAVSGLLLGNHLLGSPLGGDQLLLLATEMEGHPDNVAPCLFGGLQVCASASDGSVVHCPVAVPDRLRALALVPAFPMDTRAARSVLPKTVPLRVAVHNLGRSALLVAAMAAGRLDLLGVATEDLLHQPPRQKIFPALPRFISAALEAGALAAFLSGAGSTVLALVVDHEQEVARAMDATAQREGIQAQVLRLAIAQQGATVEPL